MAYDPLSKHVWLFGGYNYSGGKWRATNVTWEFSAGVWKKIHMAIAPSPRGESFMAWDSFDHYIVLFGGEAGKPGGRFLNDTWTLTNGSWSQLHPPTSPNPRAQGPAAYDSAVQSVVIGGAAGCFPLGGCGNDSGQWAYHAGAWTQFSGQSPWTGPRASLGFDATGHRLVFYGQCGSSQGFTAIFKNGSWRWPHLTTQPPRSSCDAPLVWDPALRTTVFVESIWSGHLGMALTWGFNQSNWTNLSRGAQPPARLGPAAAYDGADGFLLLFGGYTSTTQSLSDTWELK